MSPPVYLSDLGGPYESTLINHFIHGHFICGMDKARLRQQDGNPGSAFQDFFYGLQSRTFKQAAYP